MGAIDGKLGKLGHRDDFHVDVHPLPVELRQAGHQPAGGELPLYQQGQAITLAGFDREFRGAGGNVIEGSPYGVCVAAALVGQGNAAIAAIEQPEPQFRFEPLDLATDRRCRHVQL